MLRAALKSGGISKNKVFTQLIVWHIISEEHRRQIAAIFICKDTGDKCLDCGCDIRHSEFMSQWRN